MKNQCFGSGSIGSARFGFLDPDPDPQKYADPRIQIQGKKYQPKTAKKTFLLLKPKAELLKERKIIKISWLIKLRDKKNVKKIKQKN